MPTLERRGFLCDVTLCNAPVGPSGPLRPSSFDFIRIGFFDHTGSRSPSKYYERWPGDTTQYVFSAEEGVFDPSDTAGGLLNARLRSLGVEPGDASTITRTKVANPHTSRPVAEYLPVR
jgi:hypothetical protein